MVRPIIHHRHNPLTLSLLIRDGDIQSGAQSRRWCPELRQSPYVGRVAPSGSVVVTQRTEVVHCKLVCSMHISIACMSSGYFHLGSMDHRTLADGCESHKTNLIREVQMPRE